MYQCSHSPHPSPPLLSVFPSPSIFSPSFPLPSLRHSLYLLSILSLYLLSILPPSLLFILPPPLFFLPSLIAPSFSLLPMQYLVEVIREQQLSEWKGESSEQGDCKCVYTMAIGCNMMFTFPLWLQAPYNWCYILRTVQKASVDQRDRTNWRDLPTIPIFITRNNLVHVCEIYV